MSLTVLKTDSFHTIYPDRGFPSHNLSQILPTPSTPKSAPFLCVISETQSKAELVKYSLDLH